MADFYLDENVSDDVTPLLRALGHDVVYARRVLPSHTSDHVHLATAARWRRVLVTHNADDFELLHLAWRDWFEEWGVPPRPEHAGILLVPQTPMLSATGIAELLDDFIRALPAGDTYANRCLSWTAARGWLEIT